MATNNILEILRNNKFSWAVKGDKIVFTHKDEKASTKEVKNALELLSLDIEYSELESLIKEEVAISKEDGEDEITYKKLPPRNCLWVDDNLTEADHKLFEDIKIERLADGSMIYAIKDSSEYATYTRVMNAQDPRKLSQDISHAFVDNVKANPARVAKQILRELDAYCNTDINQLANLMPTCLYDMVKLKFVNDNYAGMWLTPDYDVFRAFVDHSYDFKCSCEHRLTKPLKTLTNNPNEPALAYCDLKKLHDEYYNKPSALWDNFLLERFHSEDALSIFKAWCYAVFVGDNNSRQEMWLYGQGGTGKGCIQYAFVEGFKKLCGKDLVLGMSKDSGKSNFNSEILNKHLGIYSDAKNLKQGMSEQHQNITGGDLTRIEGKGKEAISATVYMKLLTFSNEKPQCSMTDRAQSSRYIVLPFGLADDEMKGKGLMDKYGQLIGSSTFKFDLANEFPNFIASCEDHYKKRCPKNSNIDAHEFLNEIQSCELDENVLVDDFIENFFIIDHNEESVVSRKDLNVYIDGLLVNTTDENTGVKIYGAVNTKMIKDRLARKFGVKDGSRRIDGKSTAVNIGLQFKMIEAAAKTTEDVPF